jgi:hypothetical protein
VFGVGMASLLVAALVISGVRGTNPSSEKPATVAEDSVSEEVELNSLDAVARTDVFEEILGLNADEADSLQMILDEGSESTMKGLLLLTTMFCALTAPAFAQTDGAETQLAPADVRREAAPEANQTQRLQQQITDLYISDFKNEVGLTDEQFLKLNKPVA